MNKKYLSLISVITLILFMSNILAAPSGGGVTVVSSETVLSGDALNHTAIAGNITELAIFAGNAGSQTWQAYFGNVSGGLTMGDAAGNVLYNWSLATPSGEVYASKNSSISWINLQCFNFSATGTYTDETGNGGTTNLDGTNITLLEIEFGISTTDMDGINETFSTKNHDLFYSSNLEFSENECASVQLFTNESTFEDGSFEEIIMYEPDTKSIVFSAILEDSKKGFNDRAVDFQMLVPEDGHGADTSTTTYYFFIEIE